MNQCEYVQLTDRKRWTAWKTGARRSMC